MKQSNSETTTLPATRDSEIGTLRGGRGLATFDASRAAAWLAERTPREVDEAALLRASSPTAGLRADFGYTFPTDGRALPPARRLNVRGVAGTMADREDMARSLEPFLTPAPSRQVEEWLAELSVITKRRQDDEFTETLRIRAYSSRLAEFPADVVKDALLRHPWTFFPAWAEVEDVCKRLVAPRRAMVWHLRNAPEETAERRDLPSPERRAEIVRETREIIARMTERAAQ